MGKIGQNPKIWQFWCPVAPQPYVVQKVDRPRKLPGPWTTTQSKQYLSAVHPLACSLLWVRCLFDPLQVWGFGANDPRMEAFLKFLSKICVSPTIHVSWPNLAKIGRYEVAEKSSAIADKKTLASGTLFSPLFRPHLANSALNFMNVVGPWPLHVYQLWSKLLRFAELILERVQKVNTI